MNQSQIEREKQRAAVAYKVKKSFIGRNWFLFRGVVVVYVLASLWSAATAGGNIYIRISEMLGENIFAMGLAAVAGGCIVFLQYISGKGMVDDMQIGILKKKKNGESLYSAADQVFFFLKATGFVAMTAVSITLSINGVGKANEWFREVKNSPAIAAADVAYYDQELARIDGLIAVEKTRKWKGVLTTEASRQIKKYEANAAKLRDQRQAAIQKTDEANAGLLADYNEKTASNTSALKGVGGVAEVIIIFCVLFIGLYDDGLYREASLKTADAPGAIGRTVVGFPTPAPAFSQAQQQPTPEAYRSTQIGFNVRNSIAQQTRPAIAQQQPQQRFVNTGNFVAPSQQKAQQPKRNTGATKNPQYLSAMSAKRNAESAIRKAQQDFESGAINEERFNAITAIKRAAISRNERKAAQLKTRKA